VDFAADLMTAMYKNGSIEYAGYMEDEDLKRDLIARLGNFERKLYKRLEIAQKAKITSIINQSILKCDMALRHPEPPLYIFIFPWFPDAETSKLFGGVNAVAPHSNVMHLFVDLRKYTLTSISETVAHEYNHLVFYALHPAKNYNLLQHILLEGLAENFREDVLGGKPAPWATALSLNQAKKCLKKIEPLLGSRSSKIQQNVLFGSKEYPRWMGYAIGYNLVKDFKKRNPEMTWEQLERLKFKKFV